MPARVGGNFFITFLISIIICSTIKVSSACSLIKNELRLVCMVGM